MPSALVPYEFDGSYYALPTTNILNDVLYSDDIFEELGLTPPKLAGEKL